MVYTIRLKIWGTVSFWSLLTIRVGIGVHVKSGTLEEEPKYMDSMSVWKYIFGYREIWDVVT